MISMMYVRITQEYNFQVNLDRDLLTNIYPQYMSTTIQIWKTMT